VPNERISWSSHATAGSSNPISGMYWCPRCLIAPIRPEDLHPMSGPRSPSEVAAFSAGVVDRRLAEGVQRASRPGTAGAGEVLDPLMVADADLRVRAGVGVAEGCCLGCPSDPAGDSAVAPLRRAVWSTARPARGCPARPPSRVPVDRCVTVRRFWWRCFPVCSLVRLAAVTVRWGAAACATRAAGARHAGSLSAAPLHRPRAGP